MWLYVLVVGLVAGLVYLAIRSLHGDTPARKDRDPDRPLCWNPEERVQDDMERDNQDL
jgi:hypothetical protein